MFVATFSMYFSKYVYDCLELSLYILFLWKKLKDMADFWVVYPDLLCVYINILLMNVTTLFAQVKLFSLD